MALLLLLTEGFQVRVLAEEPFLFGSFTNTATITTQGGTSAPSTLNLAGTFTNGIGGQLKLNYAGDTAIMATLGNGGIVNVASGALLGVGTGTFASGGGFQLLANGTLNEIIQNASSSGFGVLNITGDVSLAGALNVTLLSGFNPSGDIFDILNYTGSLSGGFSNGSSFTMDGYQWTLNYGSGEVLLSAGTIPSVVAATWSTGTGNWTNSALWSCNPTYAPCMPNNNGNTIFTAAIDSPGQTLDLDSSSNPTTININSLSLVAGDLDIGAGATLNLVSGGVTDIPHDAALIVAGNFTTGGSTSALAGLTSVEGYLELDGQNLSATPGGGALTVSSTGDVRLASSTTLTVNGDLTNAGLFYTGVGTGGNTLNVTGTFTNNANAQAYVGYSASTGDVANVFALTNDGYLRIGSGATLNITGGGLGVTDVVSGSSLIVEGTLNVINSGTPSNGLGSLTGVEGYLELANGQTTGDTPNGGTLAVSASGDLRVDTASTLTVNGNLTNAGHFYTGVGTNDNTLNVSGTFTNNANAQAYVGYSASTGDVVNVNALANAGHLQIGSGATLNITGGGQGVTDVVSGSSLVLEGTLNVINGGTPSNGLGSLTSVEGQLEVANGQTTKVTPNGGTLAVATPNGDLRVDNGSTLTVNGNLANSGIIYTGVGTSGNTLNVTATFTNTTTGTAYIGYSSSTGDVAKVGSLANAGVIQVGSGATLNIAGSTDTNSGTLTLYGGTLSSPSAGGNFDNTATVRTYPGGPAGTIAIGGTFTNEGGAALTLNNSGDVAKIATQANGGVVNVAAGALLGVGTGSFSATSGYQQLANGTLDEILNSASSFGVLNITGNVSLAGPLGITLASGFDPTGDSFILMNFAGSLAGTFSNGTNFTADGYNWTLSYGTNDIILTGGTQVSNNFTATWATASGNWTNAAEWSCNPTLNPCLPNNAGTDTFSAVIDSLGNTLALDNSSNPTSITINNLSLVAGTLEIGSGATLNLVNHPVGRRHDQRKR